jgi:hypothetical protein
LWGWTASWPRRCAPTCALGADLTNARAGGVGVVAPDRMGQLYGLSRAESNWAKFSNDSF